MSTVARTAVVAALSLAIASCMVGPDYQRPTITMPARWSEPSPGGGATTPAPSPWWTVYGDRELDVLIERALRANLDLQLAESRIREARASMRASTASLWPNVDLAASAARGGQSTNAPGVSPFGQGGDLGAGTSVQNLFQAGFDANWELDLFGGARRAVEAARADMQGVAFDRDAVALSLIAEVARTYVDLRGDQARLALAQQRRATQQDALALVRSRYAGGFATDADVANAEAQLQSTEAAIPGWETLSSQAIHRLGVLLGEAPGTLTRELATARAPVHAPPEMDAGLPSDLLRRRPDIRRAERQLAAATARIGVATADLYPKFSLGASAGLASFTANDFFNRHSTIWSVGPSITWPIFRGRQIKATIEVRDAQAQQALLAYRQVILIALEDAENSLAACRSERRRHEALAAVLASNQQALAHARALYQGGLTDFRSVLDQQQRTLQAQSDLVQSTTAEWTDVIALYKALGGGLNASSTASTTPSSGQHAEGLH